MYDGIAYKNYFTSVHVIGFIFILYYIQNGPLGISRLLPERLDDFKEALKDCTGFLFRIMTILLL